MEATLALNGSEEKGEVLLANFSAVDPSRYTSAAGGKLVFPYPEDGPNPHVYSRSCTNVNALLQGI